MRSGIMAPACLWSVFLLPHVSELELFETRDLVCIMSIILYITIILMCRMLKEHFSCANESTNISGTCIDPPKETFHIGGACMCNTPKHKDPPMHACNADNTKDMLPTADTHSEFQTTLIFLWVTQISLVVSNENKKADVHFTLSACSSPLRTEKIQTHHQTLGNTSLIAQQRIQHWRSTDVLKHHVNNYSHSNMWPDFKSFVVTSRGAVCRTVSIVSEEPVVV